MAKDKVDSSEELGKTLTYGLIALKENGFKLKDVLDFSKERDICKIPRIGTKTLFFLRMYALEKKENKKNKKK